MEDKNITTVTIPLSYYNELLYAKYKLETSEIGMTQLNEYTKNTLMDLYYKQERMTQRYDTRAEMSTPGCSYFGFDFNIQCIFNILGITNEDMVQYINRRWDEFEKEQKENGKSN